MIRCGLCNKLTEVREKPVRVITSFRAVEYPYRRDAHSFIKNGTKQVKDDVGGKGLEIAKEVLAHKTCADSQDLMTY